MMYSNLKSIMKNKIIFILFCLLISIGVKGQTNYAVQLLSTEMYPYPYEGDIKTIVDTFYVERKQIEDKTYYRYMVKVESIEKAKEFLAIAQKKFADAFIVFYRKEKRFN